MTDLYSAIVIDDSTDLRLLLTRALNNEGITVHTAEDGEEATKVITAVASKSPKKCVILLDLMMPKMDGFQFLEWKKTQPHLDDWPVIILTASSQNDIPQGASALLRKPVDLSILIDLMARLMA